jgi:hypothetical protein
MTNVLEGNNVKVIDEGIKRLYMAEIMESIVKVEKAGN